MISKYDHLTKFDALDKDQVEGIDFIIKYRYIILADKMGIGKSAQALVASAYANSKNPYPTLVISPSYLTYNWKMETEKTLHNTEGVVLSTSKEIKSLGKVTNDKVYITSYDLVRRNPTLLGKFKILIWDEVHKLKSIDSAITEIVHEYVEKYKPTFCIQMTGTPLQNNAMEIYSPLCLTSYNPKKNNGLNVLDLYTPQKFQREFQFKRKVRKSGFASVEWFGLKNKPRMNQLLEKKYLRREGDLNLKVPIHKEVIVDFKKDKKLWDDFNADVSGVDSATKRDASIFKAKFTAEYVKDLVEDTKEPVVVFADHPDALKVIAEKVKNYAIIDGTVPAKTRASIVAKFQEGLIDVLLCTIGSASDGWTLTAGTTMIFNDYSWVPTENDQAMARIQRKGQDKQCTYIFILGGKCDKRILKRVSQKRDTLNKFHDNGVDLL